MNVLRLLLIGLVGVAAGAGGTLAAGRYQKVKRDTKATKKK